MKTESAATVIRRQARREKDPVVRKRLQGMADDCEGKPRGHCWVCGCTQHDCRGCVERLGQECAWADPERTLCTACKPLLDTPLEAIQRRFPVRRCAHIRSALPVFKKHGIHTIGEIIKAADGKSLPGLVGVGKTPWAYEALRWLKEMTRVGKQGATSEQVAACGGEK